MPNPVAIDWLLPVLTAPFIGSFLGVVAERLPAGRGVVLGRSACPHCGHRLRARDLVPVLSWVASGGRCRYCAAPLGLLHPAIEIAALVIALWAASELSGWLIWAGCALGWTLLALAVIDQRHLILPDRLTLPLIPAGLGVAYAVEPSLVLNHAIGAGAGFLALAVVGWAYRRLRGREGLGLGDAKLLAAAGAWVSWPGLPSVVLLAAAAALLAAAAGSLAGRSVRLTDPVPFGSYLCLGTWLVWLYGPLGFG
jgi:leader peptidase (prepilin peptidase)/N-methyltransferase